jgi:sterol desaturase/sphingolipid hydroxylase (fatty acid hydroxylase superfamily)
MGDERPPLEQMLSRVFGDDQDRSFGSGWISGTASVFFGGLAVFGVLAFWFPGAFTTAEFRARYPIELMRALLEVVIALGFVLGALSTLLRRRKVLGLTGIALSLGALLAGGGDVPIQSDFDTRFTLGLDWFALNLLLLALVFVPLERAFARLPEQTTFRFGWTTDGAHFMVNHLAVQALTFMALLPGTTLAQLWQPQGLLTAIRGQPLWLQFIEILLVADFGQYWSHRAFHTVPVLWRLHAIHHSSRRMDWLAGSRLHAIDTVVTRSVVLAPLFLLGFAQPALYAYLVFVSFHSVFIHANVRFRFGWLDHVIATPRAHHWHHAVAPVDKNFAVHLPLLDALFGTQHLPSDAEGRALWPAAYGIAGHPVPEGWWSQLRHPFQNQRPASPRL